MTSSKYIVINPMWSVGTVFQPDIRVWRLNAAESGDWPEVCRWRRLRAAAMSWVWLGWRCVPATRTTVVDVCRQQLRSVPSVTSSVTPLRVGNQLPAVRWPRRHHPSGQLPAVLGQLTCSTSWRVRCHGVRRARLLAAISWQCWDECGCLLVSEDCWWPTWNTRQLPTWVDNGVWNHWGCCFLVMCMPWAQLWQLRRFTFDVSGFNLEINNIYFSVLCARLNRSITVGHLQANPVVSCTEDLAVHCNTVVCNPISAW